VAGISSVIIKIGAETAGAVSAIKNVDNALQDTSSTGSKFQAAIGKAAIPAAAALTALGGAAMLAAKSAASAQASREQLDSQLKRSVGATDDAVKANEAWVSSMSKMAAVSAGEIRPALAGLVRATGDVTAAHKLMKDALDISAATGKPLATVSAALQKAYNGQGGSLKRLMPSLSDAALKSGEWSKVQAELNKQVGGAAKGDAATAAGQYRQLGLAMKGLQVTIGTALLPAIQAFLPVITSVFALAAQHSQVFLVIGGAVAVFAGAILVANAALSAYATVTAVAAAASRLLNSAVLQSAARFVASTASLIAYRVAQLATRTATLVFTAAQWLLNAALTANPIGIVVVALAALAAGLYLAYRHSATFRGMVGSAFQFARENVLLLLGPMGLVAKGFIELYQHSSTFRNVVVGAMNAVLAAIQLVVNAINSLIGKISSIHFPSKPSWLPLSVPMGAAGAPGAYAGAGAAPIVNVTITGAIDPESTAIAIRRTLARYDRRRGFGTLGGER
jgi:hypothetical protein